MSAHQFDSYARQALDIAKNSLLVNLRFMNAAFSRLKPLPISNATLATDGSYIRYDAQQLAQLYAHDQAELTRTYLHMVLHNVFMHLYPGAHSDELLWDTACDIVVELAMSDLNLPALQSARVRHQSATAALVKAALPLVTAETLYRYLREQRDANNLTDADIAAMREPFFADDHTPWHTMRVEEEAARKKRGEQAEEDPDGSRADAAGKAPSDNGIDMTLPPEAKKAKQTRKSHQAMDSEDVFKKDAPEEARGVQAGRFADSITLDRARDQWKNVAYEMGVQLDSYLQLWGTQSSNLSMNLRTVTRERQDYRAFLRKFARMGEQIRVNDNEFDYVFYCFGLARYGNLPLIEPLEFVEEKRIRDFVIAIDTSASTKDGLVRKFIEKTYSILADETSFFADMNVLIIQCDAAVTQVTRIGSLKDLNAYIDTLEIQGLGGTDFRPVFAYVDDALARGELTNLGGLIYFTDGHGTYPKRKPDYDTAFVFVDDGIDEVKVPPWAMKVALEETIIMEDDS